MIYLAREDVENTQNVMNTAGSFAFGEPLREGPSGTVKSPQTWAQKTAGRGLPAAQNVRCYRHLIYFLLWTTASA